MATETSTQTGTHYSKHTGTVVETLNFAGIVALVFSGLVLHMTLFVTVYEVMAAAGALTGEGAEVIEFSLRIAFEIPMGAAVGFAFAAAANILRSGAVAYRHGVAFGALFVAVFIGASILIPGMGNGLVP